MRTGWMGMALLLLPALAACGSGGGGGGVVAGGGSTVAGFTPEQPSPGALTAAMGPGGAQGDQIAVLVGVTDTQNVYGAAFTVVFDPVRVEFVDAVPGTLLESGGHTPTYQVDSPQAGRIVVGASRCGSVPAVDVTGTRTLIRLNFRLRQAGDSTLQFQAAQIYDDQLPPQPLPGVSWFGGTLHAD